MIGTQVMPNNPEADRFQARFGLRLSACLSEQSEAVPYSVSERLRFAREQAVACARAHRTQAANPVNSHVKGGVATLTIGSGHGLVSAWWIRLGSVLPLVALVAGLVLIQRQQVDDQISAAADIDADLLADALPPWAYSDAGFVEFLKIPPSL